MLKVLVVGDTDSFKGIFDLLKKDMPEVEVVEYVSDYKRAYDKTVKLNADAIVADIGNNISAKEKLIGEIMKFSDEIFMIFTGDRLGSRFDGESVEYLRTPLEYENVLELLLECKRKKEVKKYLGYVLSDKKFEDEALRSLMKNDMAYFESVFENISNGCSDISVKFVCLKLMNMAYDYFGKLGFKKIKNQRTMANQHIFELKNVAEVVEYTKIQYQNIMQFGKSDEGEFHDSVIEKIKNYIDENYMDFSVCLTYIAELFHFSPNYINDVFKNRMNISIPKYIMEVRLNKAKELLSETDMNIKSIAIAVGYDKPNYFPRVFKCKFNLSPGEYRNKLGKYNKK